jgi:antitoxin component of RelBE/YafQ-DinJ toxin-antitoxin module
MTAAKYLVAHNVAYQHLTVSEDNAKEQFMELGATCAAVRAQATRVAEAEAMPVQLDAPGDTSADTVVGTVAEATVTDAAETELAATADCGDDSGGVGSVHNQSRDGTKSSRRLAFNVWREN